jgi:hypothetical protein
MQQDPDLSGLLREVRILGVNGIGQEAGNPQITPGRTLPWLQDVPASNVWASWQVNWRDVVILDDQNRPIAIYNLTLNDLGMQAHYDYLKSLLVQAASAP